MSVKAHFEDGTLVVDIDDPGLNPDGIELELILAGYDPSQPRAPAGSSEGGQWTGGNFSRATIAAAAPGELSGGKDFAAMKASGKPMKMYAAAALELAEGFAKKGDWKGVLEIVGQMKHNPDPDASSGAAALEKLVKKKTEAKPENSKPSESDKAVLSSEGWKKVGGQLGSNAGAVYKGPDGQQYYVKQPADVEHAKAEVLAGKLAELAGAGVAKTHLLEVDGKVSVASEWISNTSQVQTAAQKAEASKDFAAQAWLANWDVSGMNADNTLIDSSGKAVCIDMGGSLMYRAQGKKKLGFDGQTPEFDLMRLKQNSAGHLYAEMTPEQIGKSAERLAAVKDADIRAMIDKYGPGTPEEKNKLASVMIDRKNDILQKAAAVHPPEAKPSKQASKPAPEPEQVQKAVQAAGVAKTALPEKPVMTAKSAQWINPKFDALEAAAKSGDVNAVLAVKTNPGSKTLLMQKAHEYKLALVAAMSGKGEQPAGAPKTKPPAPPKKTQAPLNMPPKPSFNLSHNIEAAKKIEAAGQAGDLDALMTMALPSNGKISKYHSEIVAAVKSHFEAKPELKSLAGESVAVNKDFADTGKRVGEWAVMRDLRKTTVKQPIQIAFQEKLFDEGKKNFLHKLNPQEKDTLEAYTYDSTLKNQYLRTGKLPHVAADAERAARAVEKASVEIPQGTVLYRRYSPPHGPNSLSEHVMGLEETVGKVISDKGLLSTSSNGDAWQGKVEIQMTVGPGVKGLPARGFSAFPKEDEVILPRNTRMVVTKVHKAEHGFGVSVIVHAVILPNDSQPGHAKSVRYSFVGKTIVIDIIDPSILSLDHLGEIEIEFKNCGIGPGGFRPGNTCARGGGLKGALKSVMGQTGYSREEIEQALTTQASPGGGGEINAERRTKITAALLKDGAMPDAVSQLMEFHDVDEAKSLAAGMTTGDKKRAAEEYANTPIYDLQVLGGMEVKSTEVSGDAVCNMGSRKLTMGSTTRTGSFRHELGHAIHSMFGGKSWNAKTEMNDAVQAEFDVVQEKVKKNPAGLHSKQTHDWYEENYGVVGRRSLDTEKENLAEHYRLLHRESYRDRAEGGNGKYMKQYRERHPGWAKIWDAHYTAALLGHSMKNKQL